MASVGVDLDGVVYPFDEVNRAWLKDRGHGDFPPAKQWRCYEDWGMTETLWVAEYVLSIDYGHMFAHGGTIPGSKENLTKLQEEGHTIHIVTARTMGQLPVENTMIWLKRENIPYDTLTFSVDKSIIKVDFFIEDNVDNYERLRAHGVEAFLLKQPWNTHGPEDHRLTWDEFYERVSK
jgi:5'(3')-deoxyribonucleotidase